MNASDTRLIVTVTSMKFPLGQIVITANANAQLATAAVLDALGRHAAGDWGDLVPEDIQSNEDGLKHGNRLLSAYGKGDGRFWIITERDRSVTTILMPEDY
jgi:hypothetical protein